MIRTTNTVPLASHAGLDRSPGEIPAQQRHGHTASRGHCAGVGHLVMHTGDVLPGPCRCILYPCTCRCSSNLMIHRVTGRVSSEPTPWPDEVQRLRCPQGRRSSLIVTCVALNRLGNMRTRSGYTSQTLGVRPGLCHAPVPATGDPPAHAVGRNRVRKRDAMAGAGNGLHFSQPSGSTGVGVSQKRL